MRVTLNQTKFRAVKQWNKVQEEVSFLWTLNIFISYCVDIYKNFEQTFNLQAVAALKYFYSAIWDAVGIISERIKIIKSRKTVWQVSVALWWHENLKPMQTLSNS